MIDSLLSAIHNWQIRRRKRRHIKLERLFLEYSILAGNDYWHSSPWYIERMIKRSIKSSVPFYFNDSPESMGLPAGFEAPGEDD